MVAKAGGQEAKAVGAKEQEKADGTAEAKAKVGKEKAKAARD